MKILLVTLAVLSLAVGTAGAQTTPTSYTENFATGSRLFEDAVGFVRVRQSGSTAETDYAPGIAAATGANGFYSRLVVQPGTNINGDQIGPCTPGAPPANNNFSCGGPLTEWGLPWAGFDGQFDSGIPINQGGSATTSIKIYLDTAFAASTAASGADYRFDWDSALLDSNTNGPPSFLQDYVFNVATGQTGDSCAPSSGGYYVIEVSNGYQRTGANAHDLSNPLPQVCITKSNWYTFEHQFHADSNGNLQVDMMILKPNGSPVGSWTLHPTCLATQDAESLCNEGDPLPFTAVGANFFGYFPDQEINDLPIDTIERRPQ